VGVLVLCILSGFAFAFYKFHGKTALYIYVVAGLSIPFYTIIIPLYFQLRTLNLLNTHWAVIIPQTAITLPFGVLLMRSFMLSIDRAFIEAAQIDGCAPMRLLSWIIVPMSTPAISSLLIFTFMWTWNNLFLPMVVITKSELRTIPLGLTFFQGEYSTEVTLLCATAVVSSLPVLLTYLLFQGQFIRGITAGGIRG
jgi:ABC-type glycerol-3-phosphate transport system permease component